MHGIFRHLENGRVEWRRTKIILKRTISTKEGGKKMDISKVISIVKIVLKGILAVAAVLGW